MKKKSRTIILTLTITLFLLSLAYFIKGYYTLVFETSRLGARDLFDRWKEQQYIYQGIFPYRMSVQEIDPKLGRVWSGGYPPWAFFTGFIFFPNVAWSLTRSYHALLNFISLGILALFAYQIGSPFGQRNAYFFVAACLAISSHCTTLNVGQYGIEINALLIGIFWLLNKHKNSWAGLLLGIAMAKPTISAPYLLLFVVQKRINALIITFIYLIFATLSISFLTKLSFLTMVNRLLEQVNVFAGQGLSSINFAINLGFNPLVATVLLALVGASIILTIFYCWRNTSLLTLFAVACVIARVSTYHRFYDNLMLIFLLLALLKLTFNQPDKFNIFISGLVALSLWLPGKMTELSYFQTFQLITWSVALIYLLIQEKSQLKSI